MGVPISPYLTVLVISDNNHPCETELPCHSEFDLHYAADFLKRSLFSYTVGYLIVFRKVCVRVYCPIPDSFVLFGWGMLFCLLLFCLLNKKIKVLKDEGPSKQAAVM